MNNDISTILEESIYPAIYERAEEALPEFEFKPIGSKGYRATTGLKVTGEQGKKGAVYYYANNVGYLVDYTRDSLSLWDYIKDRDGLDNAETLKRLADLAGVDLPQRKFSKDELERLQAEKRLAQLREDANSFFIHCLSHIDNPHAKGQIAERVREYLTKERGYKSYELALPGEENSKYKKELGITPMELGYIPSKVAIEEYLESQGYLKEEIAELGLPGGVGSKYLLTIPYRQGSKVIGFSFRAIDTEVKPKYLYTVGSWRSGALFNIRAGARVKDIVVVEGLLDALVASARGIEDVVALGGTSLNEQQLKLAQRRGVRNFTLCLDNDKAGQEATERAIELIQRTTEAKIYVAQLPDGVKDVDDLIREHGADSFEEVLREAQREYRYRLAQLLQRYGQIEQEQGSLSDKDKQSFLEEVVELGAGMRDPLDRTQFNNLFLGLEAVQGLGITQEAVEDAIEELRYKKEEVRRARELSKALRVTRGLLDKGETNKALDGIGERLKEIKKERGRELITPYTVKDWERELRDTAPALRTGIESLDDIVRIPQGAITLVAGRPSHGKTTFMFNLLLEMAEIHPGKFYFFSYEEQKKYIYIKVLNRLINQSLEQYYPQYPDIRPSNYEFLKVYLKEGREDIAAIEEGKVKLYSLIDRGKIEVVDRSYTVEELGSLIQYLNSREQIGGVFIDYIQRMTTERRTQDKRTEIAHISDSVLQVAKDTGLPIMLGAQLNRGGVGSPRLENLKEAGNLEEDANLVLSVYNEARENSQQEDGRSYGRQVELEIKTLKARDSEPNKEIKLLFDRWTLHIADLDRKYFI